MELEVTEGRFISEIQSDSNGLNGKTKHNKTSISEVYSALEEKQNKKWDAWKHCKNMKPL